MLLEEGFTVTSVDASDKMLKQAHKTRWNRRKEDKFDEWGNHFYTRNDIVNIISSEIDCGVR